jgi:phage shock protein C
MRSSRDRKWAGVAGGLAEYFDVDPTLVRVLWVALAILTSGAAVALYVVLWFVMPRDDRPEDLSGWRGRWPEDVRTETRQLIDEARGVVEPSPHVQRADQRQRLAGVILVLLGLLFFGQQVGIFHWINWGLFWPVVLIGAGVLLLARQAGWRRW